MLKYQVQDIRSKKTKRVVTRALPQLADCTTDLVLDIPQKDAESDLNLLRRLADFHNLESLRQLTKCMLNMSGEQH